MAKDIHELSAQVNAKTGFTTIKTIAANSISVSKNGIVIHPRVTHEGATDRVIVGDGSGIMIADSTRWVASLR